jgi:hypothetical protein
VSGGCYIASAYTAIQQSPGDFNGVPPFSPGSPEELYLRNHSSYIALGFGGKFYALHRALRGLLVNLALIGLLLFVVGVPVGWWFSARVDPSGLPSGSTLHLAQAAPVIVGKGSTIEVRRHPGDLPENVLLAPGTRILVTSGDYEAAAHVHPAVQTFDTTVAAGTAVPTAASAGVQLAPQRVTLARAAGVQLQVKLPASTYRSSSVHLAKGSRVASTPRDTTIEVSADSIVSRLDARGARSTIRTVDKACGSEPCVTSSSLGRSLLIALLLVGLALVAGLVDLLLRAYERVAAITEAWSVRLTIAAASVFVVGVFLPEAVERLLNWVREGRGGLGGFLGLSTITVWAGVIAALLGTSPAVVANEARTVEKFVRKAAPRVRALLLRVAAYVAGPLLLIVTAVGFVTVGAAMGLTRPTFGLVVGALASLATLWAVGDLTRWSLHPFYKRRLSSAFMLERYEHDGTACARPWDLDLPFPISSLSPVAAQDPASEHPRAVPDLVVCAAANVSTQGATPPHRNATAFTFTRRHIGGDVIGKVPTACYEDLSESYWRDVTLPTAVAVSGAAFSPAMGKMSKPAYRFLMALGNARLGVWFPNPAFLRKRAGVQAAKDARTMRRSAEKELARALSEEAKLKEETVEAIQKLPPGRDDLVRTAQALWSPDDTALVQTALDECERCMRERKQQEYEAILMSFESGRLRYGAVRPHYLLYEMLNHHELGDRFVYLTDGGHFENLGVVELLRRGCTKIYCFDASGGPPATFSTLGQAIALADSELGVKIDIDPTEMVGADGTMVADHVVGKLRLDEEDEPFGTIVYARAAVVPTSPWDIRAYAQRDAAFPNDPTYDQLYTDERFDAYRRLGRYAAQNAYAAMHPAPAPPASGNGSAPAPEPEMAGG